MPCWACNIYTSEWANVECGLLPYYTSQMTEGLNADVTVVVALIILIKTFYFQENMPCF